jgi:hypothetical protein
LAGVCGAKRKRKSRPRGGRDFHANKACDQ